LSYFDTVSERPAWPSTQDKKICETDVIWLNSDEMELAGAPAIRAALAEQVAHGNYGTAPPPAELSRSLIHYYQQHYDWTIQADWIVWLPSVSAGINLALRACCGPDDGAIAFSPGLPGLSCAPGLQGRELIDVPLIPRVADNAAPLHYDLDFERLEVAMLRSSLLQLCHPCSPLGRIYSDEELDRLADLCERHNQYVCSVEADGDLILDGGIAHVPFAKALAQRSPLMFKRMITLSGPGAAYKLSGIGIGWAIIPDSMLRSCFREARQGLVPEPNRFAWGALQAALTGAESWRQETLATLQKNRALVSAALDQMALPHTHPQAACLSWIDARALAAQVGKIVPHFERHGVGLSDGARFGRPGFVGMNFACTPGLLNRALERMRKAVMKLAR
jgi:cystathionine beta-lyase